jgi:hypothetical protein
MGILTYILLGGVLALQTPPVPQEAEEKKALTWEMNRKGEFLVKWKYEENTRHRDKYRYLKRFLDKRDIQMTWTPPEKEGSRQTYNVKIKKARWVYEDVKFRITLDYVAGKKVKETSSVKKIFAPLHPELRNIDMVRARQELALKVAAMKQLLVQKYVLSMRSNGTPMVHTTGTAVRQRARGVGSNIFAPLFVTPSLANKTIERGKEWLLNRREDLPFGTIPGAVIPVLKVRSCSGKNIILDTDARGRVGTKQYILTMKFRYSKEGYLKFGSAIIRNGDMRKTMTLSMQKI